MSNFGNNTHKNILGGAEKKRTALTGPGTVSHAQPELPSDSSLRGPLQGSSSFLSPDLFHSPAQALLPIHDARVADTLVCLMPRLFLVTKSTQ